ncbi:RdgB/HAM1 family non-canonical purine NTP pyrophosphatase [Dyadobacter sp. CY356]|uniref:RdgB/HAM1 family non-canonical purine NTP pyrophosphatase n=1 Tax=Dyadobacter sp. CY356 TaxID=2906442 RepID=UPI001F376D0E|nr:RdgB/HAM1 family non-canonical purine NTP pyrophosphatase [Dyadobacter sp. CY356]MCF0057508.1 RdgB/HAM1 family non-canonical purine NTP pyrophosphatase [Dyadobacter sp. CY356]
MKLCFATNNQHKLEEVQAMLGDSFILTTLKEIGCEEEIPETHDTIPENSYEKAEFVWNNYAVNCFADDSGLEIEALDGAPGVHSAYYAGPQRDADDNMDLVIKNMTGKDNFNARFVAVITLVLDGKFYQFDGEIKGKIILEKRGTYGFGYNPIFIPEGHNRTFAEMTMEEKGGLSHRARAFAKLEEFLKNYTI